MIMIASASPSTSIAFISPLSSSAVVTSMNEKEAEFFDNDDEIVTPSVLSQPKEFTVDPVEWSDRMKVDSEHLWYRDELIEYLGQKAVDHLRNQYLQSTAKRMKEVWSEQESWSSLQVETFYKDYVQCFSAIVDAMIAKKKREQLEKATRKYSPYFLYPKDAQHEAFAFTHILSHVRSEKQGLDLAFLMLRQRPDLFVNAHEER